MVRFPNLTWAIGQKRFAHYEIAVEVRIERTRFSRCLHGAGSFAPHEKSRISEVLGFAEEWLFQEPKPLPAPFVPTLTMDLE
jgi:hypothetical protein